jgi:hypothetical protein
MHVQQIIATHPQLHGDVNAALIRAIEASFDCAQACTACADACLGEDRVKDLLQCVRLNLDCADVCTALGSLASRRTGSDERILARMLEVCAEACRVCGDECERHADHMEHCRICADACNACETACRQARDSVAPGRH